MTPPLPRLGGPRPVNDPEWSAFARWAASPGSGVPPGLADSDRNFGLHGWLIYLAFKAGYDVGRFESLNGGGGGI